MRLEDLLADVDAKIINSRPELAITTIETDSRKVGSDTLYFALPGTKTDGQQYIDEVIERGAVAIMCSSEWLNSRSDFPETVTFIGVQDRRKAFAKISANFYQQPAKLMRLIGVTGTNGKTTTTHLIENILVAAGAKTGLLGTLYYKYGEVKKEAKYTTPMADQLQSVFREMADHQVDDLIMEVSSHALEQYRVGACDFSVAVFTNITQDHLDYHPTFADYQAAKGILFAEQLKTDGVAIINYDDPAFNFFREKAFGKKVFSYGLNSSADIYATDIELKMDGSSFRVYLPDGELKLELNLLGKFNVYNTLAAVATGYALGISAEVMKKALEATTGIAGRIEIVTPKAHPFTVVVDYAHTPDSLENILTSAREFTTHRLISVFGCGGNRDRTKRPLMGGIAKRLSDLTVVTSDNPRQEEPEAIIADILTGITDQNNVFIQVDRREAIGMAVKMAQAGDTVVIAGKGHEDYQIFSDRTIHFDDRETAREFIDQE